MDIIMGKVEIVQKVLSLCSSICQMVGSMKTNKERFKRTEDRVKMLELLVLAIKEPGQISPVVELALQELCITLSDAKALMAKYCNVNGFKSFIKSSTYEDKFIKMNEKLTDSFQVLSGALQVEQRDILLGLCQYERRDSCDSLCPYPTCPLPSPAPVPSLPVPSLPVPSLPAPSLPVPSLPAPSLPVPSLPAPSLPAPSLPAPSLPVPLLPPTPMFPSMPMSNPTAPFPIGFITPPMPACTPFFQCPGGSAVLATNYVSKVYIPGNVSLTRPMTFTAQQQTVVIRYVTNNTVPR